MVRLANLHSKLPVNVCASCFLSSDDFLKKIRNQAQVQTVWMRIRPDVLPGLIWVPTVCKGDQQTTLAEKELNKDIPLQAAPSDIAGYFFFFI